MANSSEPRDTTHAPPPTPAVGDTVDPSTLPVGAEFRLKGDDITWLVVAPGRCQVKGSTFETGIVSSSAVLVSLPTPRRPPCDVCGKESWSKYGAYTSDDRICPCFLCEKHWEKLSPDEYEHLLARRANQTPPGSGVAPSLPTYDQIAGWLGEEWVMTRMDRDKPTERDWGPGRNPSPWYSMAFGGAETYYCYLKHSPTGQRVEVTAPSWPASMGLWAGWFIDIAKLYRPQFPSEYSKHVRWLDPDTSQDETIVDSLVARATAENKTKPILRKVSPEPAVPPHCSSCLQPFWAGRIPWPKDGSDNDSPKRCGDCVASGCVDTADHLTNGIDTRIAEVQPEAVEVRGAWRTPCSEGEF